MLFQKRIILSSKTTSPLIKAVVTINLTKYFSHFNQILFLGEKYSQKEWEKLLKLGISVGNILLEILTQLSLLKFEQEKVSYPFTFLMIQRK